MARAPSSHLACDAELIPVAGPQDWGVQCFQLVVLGPILILLPVLQTSHIVRLNISEAGILGVSDRKVGKPWKDTHPALGLLPGVSAGQEARVCSCCPVQQRKAGRGKQKTDPCPRQQCRRGRPVRGMQDHLTSPQKTREVGYVGFC